MINWILDILNKKKRRYTGKLKKICNIEQDFNDPRDFNVPSRTYVNWVPDEYILRSNIKVKNQGSIGSCGAHAYATAFEIMNERKGRILYTSELFHYYIVREYEDNLFVDGGMQLRNGAKMLRNKGIALERFHSYDIQKWLDKPSFRAYVTARALRIKAYRRVWSVDDMKNKLFNDGSPIIFGFKVWDSFMRNKRELVPMPDIQNEKYKGGHAVVIIGFDDKLKAFKIINSWGVWWGNNGYAYIPYDYIRKYMLDAWTIELY